MRPEGDGQSGQTGALRISCGPERLFELLSAQVSNLFFLERNERNCLERHFDSTLNRVERCFTAIEDKYYSANGGPIFSPYHSGQYCIFLYFFANTAFLSDGDRARSIADKLYCLNKALNGLDLFYEVQMPNVFFLNHPVGSVMGRANYGEFFDFRQNCTVGQNKGKFPTIGERVKMMSGAKILGDSLVGKDSIISANAYVKDAVVPEGCVVFGQSPNLIFKKR